MITLLALLLALPILGLMAVLAVPLLGGLAVIAAPVLVALAILAVPALAIAALAGAFSNVNVPVLGTLEVLGIAVGVLALIAVAAYVADRLASRTRAPALRPQEVQVGAREQVIVEPRRQAAVGMASQTIPADLAAQCQGLQSVPCPV